MIESKFYNKKQEQNTNPKLKKKLRILITKFLITIIIMLIILISFKLNSDFKTAFNEYVYNKTLPFTDFKEIYDYFFKGSKKESTNIETVFYENLKYKSSSLYEDGVKLTVNKNYLVPALDSGIVVFIGNKDKYGQTVIIQQMNGVDVFYGNVNSTVNMYDYVEKGSLIGESLDTTIYLAFQKEGKFVDYKEYLS